MAWWDHEELKDPRYRSERYKKAFPKPANTVCWVNSSGEFIGGDYEYYKEKYMVNTSVEPHGLVTGDAVHSHDDDFGFTTADDTLTPVVVASENSQHKLDQVMEKVRGFFEKLQIDPDKPVLKWPNRAQEAKAFLDKLEALYRG